MENLKIKRGAEKRKLTNFTKFLNNISQEDDDLMELQARYESALKIKENFEDFQDKIEASAANIEDEFEYRDDFENTFFKAIARAKKILNKSTEICTLAASEQSLSAPFQNTIKLPTIALPKFDGEDTLTWIEFRDLFLSLIHENESITAIQKFHYLRASLHGTAAQVIKSLDFTATNYVIAWNVLCERFNNKELLVHNHIQAIFNLEPIHKENAFRLRHINDMLFKHVTILNSLMEKETLADSLLLYMIANKLDPVTLREWEMKKKDSQEELPSLSSFMEFLKQKATLLETIDCTHKKPHDKAKTNFKSLVATTEVLCSMCKGNHSLSKCPSYQSLPVNDRMSKVKEFKACLNCLHKGHFVSQCKSKFSCGCCKKRHHTSLHRDDVQPEKKMPTNNDEVFAGISSSVKKVLLPTIILGVRDANNKTYKVRALLDSGSQSNFISSSLCRKLKVQTANVTMTVSGISDSTSRINSKCEVDIFSLHSNYKLKLGCLIIDCITGTIPGFQVDVLDLQIPANIRLSDPSFGKPGPIDMLIGASVFWNLMCVGQIELGPERPILHKTRFGWIVSGYIPSSNLTQTQCHFAYFNEVQNQLAQFWEIDQFPSKKRYTNEEQACERIFEETTKRSNDGRFIVNMPLKESPQALGESFESAKKRFLSLEKRLEKNKTLQTMYTDFIKEYVDLGHMTCVKDMPRNSFYLPHHGVLKEDSLTTKLRVVFDASSPSSSGKSLNDIQLIGPIIQSDLISILLRFRQYRFAISADITKMYRQVLINPQQRTLQRILWRFNNKEPIKVYELNTVTYGTAAASFLAIRCLKQLANECKEIMPNISKIIEEDFYVDDVLTGSDNLLETQTICKHLSSVLASGCFPLRKWISNEPSVLEFIDETQRHPYLLDLGSHADTKTLGLGWSFQSDMLVYKISTPSSDIVTKRSILSQIAQIFDPIGLLSPCTLYAKIILQQLWLEKLSWDESIPNALHHKWLSFRDNLKFLNNLEIPRHALIVGYRKIEIHGYCDASNLGYGGCVYLRSVDQNNQIKTELLCSKCRVAPLKPMTIPCLELCGAVILARLVNQVLKSLRLSVDQVFCWTDSSIVLGWLKMNPNRLKIFVSNRVVEIQSLIPNAKWKHVPTTQNPADFLSRGVTPSQLLDLQQWWKGPSWLAEDEESWPSTFSIPEVLPQTKLETKTLLVRNNQSMFDRFSELSKLQRVTAYCLRFIKNCSLSKNARIYGSLSRDELRCSLLALAKMSQEEAFPEELKNLRKGIPLRSSSYILKLNPFLRDGIMRVGGRLTHSNLAPDQKHPILISGKHRLAHLILKREHIRSLHCGPMMLLYTVRATFWITSGRSEANKVVRNCIRCFRASPSIASPIMGNLPSSRLKPNSPFTICGVDYAGPILIKDRKTRGCKYMKSYICLFICFSVKAIHLELVTALDTESFMMALKRFVARRGKPEKIYSDNGCNFVGAANELKELGLFLSKNNDIQNKAAEMEVDWHFIPPHSPHFGGLWEAGVKSVKHHIKRVAGNVSLTYEEFLTLLYQIEGILNSRPLSALSSDPNDLEPLTPAHFLIGRPITSLPDLDVTTMPENRLSVYQKILRYQQHIWSRWNKEYVSSLQERSKWSKGKSQLEVGALVLIKDDNTPSLRWKLGRITALHPGTDGVNRVASIRTSSGIIQRSFAKLCVLPGESV